MDLTRVELGLRVLRALLEVQMTEKTLKKATTFSLPKEDFIWEKMLSEDAKERMKTLGFFIRKLEERVDADPEFSGVLQRFLDDRTSSHMIFCPCLALNLTRLRVSTSDLISR